MGVWGQKWDCTCCSGLWGSWVRPESRTDWGRAVGSWASVNPPGVSVVRAPICLHICFLFCRIKTRRLICLPQIGQIQNGETDDRKGNQGKCS